MGRYASATEWLANITLPYILAVVGVLVLLRLMLGKATTPGMKSIAEGVESALIAVVLVFLVIRPFVVQAFYIPSGSMLPTLQLSDHILVNKFIYRFLEPRHGDIVVFKSPPWASIEEPVFNRAYWNRIVAKVNGPVGNNGEVSLTLISHHPEEIAKVRRVCVQRNGNAQLRDVVAWSDNCKSLKLVGVNDAESAKELKGAEIRVVEKDFIKRVVGVPGDVLEVVAGKGLIRNGKLLNEPYLAEEPFYDMPPTKVPNGMFFMMGDNRNNSNDSHMWGFLSQDRVVGKALFRFWPLNRLGLPR